MILKNKFRKKLNNIFYDMFNILYIEYITTYMNKFNTLCNETIYKWTTMPILKKIFIKQNINLCLMTFGTMYLFVNIYKFKQYEYECYLMLHEMEHQIKSQQKRVDNIDHLLCTINNTSDIDVVYIKSGLLIPRKSINQ